jgi:FAD-dependent urate hydroxylase
MENLKVIIIGAGMGGLTAGIALQQAGYTVEIYERFAALRPSGAALSLWSNGIKVLNRLGLGPAVAAIGGPMAQMAYYNSTGEKLTRFSLAPLVAQVGQRPYPVARTDLQAMLLHAVGQVHLNAHCIAIEQDDHSATALFADGRRATGDLVIGSDGARSVLRSWVAGREVPRRYRGYVNWNGLIPASPDLGAPDCWVTYVGDHKRAALMPVAGDRFYFFLDVPMPAGSDSAPERYQDDLAAAFRGWAAPVQTLIERIDPTITNRVEIYDIDPLEQWVRGRVALLGDAAHSTAPDLGQGGCLALEDAWVLANCLKSHTISVTDSLQRYQAARQARTASIIHRARQRSDITHGKDPQQTQRWYEELAQEDGGSRILAAIGKTILAGPLG